MESYIKYKKGKFILGVVKHRKRDYVSKRKMNVDKFYNQWSKEITEHMSVGDFSFVDENHLHIMWLDFSIVGAEVRDEEFVLEESIIDNVAAMEMFKDLESKFLAVEEEARRSFERTASRLKELDESSKLAEKILRRYVKTWSLDDFDMTEVGRVVEYIHDKPLFYLKFKSPLADVLEMLTIEFFKIINWAAIGASLGKLLYWVVGLFNGTWEGSPEDFSFAFGCWVLVGFCSVSNIFSKYYNVRTIEAFLEEYEEKKSFEEIRTKKELFDSLYNDIVNEDLTAVRSLDVEMNLPLQVPLEDEMRVPSLKERFDRLDALLAQERQVYSSSDDSMSAVAVVNVTEGLKKRLAYLGVSSVDVEKNEFLSFLLGLSSQVNEKCYEDLGADVISIYSLAIDYVRMRTRYRDSEFLKSSEYNLLFMKRRLLNEHLANRWSMMESLAKLTAARDTLAQILAETRTLEPVTIEAGDEKRLILE